MRQFLIVALLVCLSALSAWATDANRTGTAGALELRIPISARGTALGPGVMADVTGVEAIYYNPAGISGLTGTELYFSHLNYIADMKKNYFAAAIKTGVGAFGVAADVFSVGDIEVTTLDQPDGTGQTFSPTFSVIGGSYSRFLTDAVSVGATAKVINESILDVSATGVAFDVGLQYRPPWQKNIHLGLLLRDFGPKMTYSGAGFESFHGVSQDPTAGSHVLASENAAFELPSTFQIGLSYTPYSDGANRVTGYGDFTNNNFGRDEYSIGAEYSFKDILALRGNYVATGNSDYNFGPSFGVGLRLPLGPTTNLRVDYAIRTVKSYFDNNQLFAVTFAF